MPKGARLEKLTIENFAGIRHLEMDVSPFTLLIGPQSVGKSLTAKVLYFFKSLPRALYAAAKRDQVASCEFAVLREFQELFPHYQGIPTLTWAGSSQSEIRISGMVVSVPDSLRKAYEALLQSSGLGADVLESVDNQIHLFSESSLRVEQAFWRAADDVMPSGKNGAHAAYFIPAGRSFYAQIERDAASFYTTAQIDPFVNRFGKLLAQIKNRSFWSEAQDERGAALRLANELLGGVYTRENNEDWILAADGRRLPSSVWSSGQQEAHPLAAMLRQHCGRIMAPSHIFIEEPEAHLFPTSQRVMTELIALAFNAQIPSTRVFLTTHSPYILTTINNLLQAGQLYAGSLSAERKNALNGIVPEDRALAPGSVGVIYMDRDSCHSIMDEETGLIGTSEIDKASWDLSEQFEALLETQPS